MLKLKDNVTEEDLEKLGFFSEENWMHYGDMGDDRFTYEPHFEISICMKNQHEYDLPCGPRTLYTSANYIPAVILDLIEAGLVERENYELFC